MVRYEVIVVGLGAMGSAAAHHLARRNIKTLGLEKFGPIHAHGSSHGFTRLIRQAYFEDPAYVPLVVRAYQLWEELERDTGEVLLTRTGGLMIGPPTGTIVTGTLRSATEHRLAHETLSPSAVRERFPAFALPDDVTAVYEAAAGFVRPERGMEQHQKQAQQAGAVLRFDEPVVSWEATEEGVHVTTSRDSYHAERLVLTPGAWVKSLARWDIPVKISRQTLFWIDPEANADLFSQKRFPVFVWELSEGDFIYGFPTQNEPGVPGGVKVAFFHRPRYTDPDHVDRTIAAEEMWEIRDVLKDRLPDLSGPVVYSTTCLYTETPDRHFAVGLHPLYPNVVLASPCSGHGYKFAPVIGEILADLAEYGATRHRIDLFRLTRFLTSS